MLDEQSGYSIRNSVFTIQNNTYENSVWDMKTILWCIKKWYIVGWTFEQRVQYLLQQIILYAQYFFQGKCKTIKHFCLHMYCNCCMLVAILLSLYWNDNKDNMHGWLLNIGHTGVFWRKSNLFFLNYSAITRRSWKYLLSRL